MTKIHDAYVKASLPIKQSVEASQATEAKPFFDVLKEVNDLQQSSGELKEKFQLGDPNVSLEQVMITSQKANVGFEAVLRVRNKFVEAYKEIMNMQV